MKVGRSKNNFPTIAESGGGMTNTGGATVICGADGEAMKPLFVPRGYSNGDHAIFIVQPGLTHLVRSVRGKWGESCQIERVIGIDEDGTLQTVAVAEYENGDGNIPAEFQNAVRAAIEKAKCYHCREPHFIK